MACKGMTDLALSFLLSDHLQLFAYSSLRASLYTFRSQKTLLVPEGLYTVQIYNGQVSHIPGNFLQCHITVSFVLLALFDGSVFLSLLVSSCLPMTNPLIFPIEYITFQYKMQYATYCQLFYYNVISQARIFPALSLGFNSAV